MNHEKLTLEMLQKAKDKMENRHIPPVLFISEIMIKESKEHGMIYEKNGKNYMLQGLKEIEIIAKDKA